MEDIEARPVRETDASELATLLNEIIARGGTTALEEPFTPDALARALLTGPDVICCFVAVEQATGRLLGFQSLERSHGLPDDVGDIGTFVRVGLTQRGVGTMLFTATRVEAERNKLQAINEQHRG
jgi:L-amino acid N-acyltransferase YncA